MSMACVVCGATTTRRNYCDKPECRKIARPGKHRSIREINDRQEKRRLDEGRR